MKPLINRRTNLRMNYLVKRLRDLSNGSECDVGSENVITLSTRFFKVVTGFK